MVLRRVVMSVLILIALACGAETTTEPTMAAASSAERVTFLVTFRGNASPRSVAARLASAHNGRVVHVYEHALRGMAIEVPLASLNGLQRDPEVARVETDARVHEDAVASWGLDRIDQRNLPLNNTYNYGSDAGQGVHVYILDTGIRATHQEFGGRVLAGVNFVPDENGTNDCRGHGTHVAGTVGGATVGVAPQVQLVPVRVLDCTGWGLYSDVIAGVDWVTEHAVKPAVANMSLGGAQSTTLNKAVEASIASGIIYSVSAGNSNLDACTQSPASVPTALTVGASESNDNRAGYSNFGACVDIFAPGTNIVSAYYTSDNATLDMSGTSMASPHVAGMAARYLDRNATASPSQISNAILSMGTEGVIMDARANGAKLLYDVFGTEPNNPPAPDNTLPVAEFSLYYIQGTYRVAVNPMAWDPDGVINSIRWNWGDGLPETSGLGVTYHNYSGPGTYNITMVVQDNAFGQATTSKPAQVSGTTQTVLPTADFTVNCSATTCTFTNTSSDNGTITRAVWYFGDGTSLTALGPVIHTYQQSGTYSVRLFVEDNEGAADYVVKTVTTEGSTEPPPPPPTDNPPVAGLVLVGCSSGGDLLCDFRSTSTDDFGIVKYFWDFGDGTRVYAGSTVRHDYNDATNVTVRLTIYDAKDQTGTASLAVNLRKYAKGRGNQK